MHDLRAPLEELLTAAGAVAMARFGRASVEVKPDGSPVTDADRAVEALIVERLSRWFPGDAIVSEEGERVTGTSGASWHVDPIDGTSSYVRRLADWGPTVCRVVDGALDVGALHLPRLREHWFAARGGGAWRDGERLLAAREPARVDGEDVLFAPSRFHLAGRTPWPGKVRALGSTAAHLAYVAADAGLVAVIPSWCLWDVGCGALLVHEVGRVIWDAAGETVEPESASTEVPLLAGSPTALRLLTANGWARAVVERARSGRVPTGAAPPTE